MGIPGLWNILHPAKQQHSLLHLTLANNPKPSGNGRTGYRIGIDVSIWFFHATSGAQGENHELRLLFFRLARLLNIPSCLPLFFFDGPDRPEIKRGKKLNRKHHWMEDGTKRLLMAFGFEWVQAPGEAEAELAFLNRIDVIDAVMTDDVDALLFGAPIIIRTLRGRGSKRAEEDESHVSLYRLDDISNAQAGGVVGLSRAGLILIGILSGGDYNQGIKGCGVKISFALAQCGLGEELLSIGIDSKTPDTVAERLRAWRLSLRRELLTNSQGRLGRTYPSLANSIPDTFPSLNVLRAYTSPLTSESSGEQPDDALWWSSQPQLPDIAAHCELYFEWGFEDAILRRFCKTIWPGFCKRLMLWNHTRAPPAPGFSTFNIDGRQESANNPFPLALRIHSSRCHHSTGGILEYRLEISPTQLATVTVSTLKGTRQPLGSAKSAKTGPPTDSTSPFRLWLPASIALAAIPHLVADFERREHSRGQKGSKSRARARRAEAAPSDMDQQEDSDADQPSRKLARKTLDDPGIDYVVISSSDDEPAAARPARQDAPEVIDLTGLSDS